MFSILKRGAVALCLTAALVSPALLPAGASAAAKTQSVTIAGQINCTWWKFGTKVLNAVIWTPQTGSRTVSTGAGTYRITIPNVPQSGTYLNYSVTCSYLTPYTLTGQVSFGWPSSWVQTFNGGVDPVSI